MPFLSYIRTFFKSLPVRLSILVSSVPFSSSTISMQEQKTNLLVMFFSKRQMIV